ncbi:A-factor-processing enzyme [[Candida] anglica]|uniref:A-factor-processing enzyme n=1 Tax=[Candida] anglica TaxID=148631 RepID=A0ABP0E9H1_9ASCO
MSSRNESSGGYTVVADAAAINKPLLDDRTYRLIKLNRNNLHVLAIHDPSTDKSAASLDVGVGSFADRKYKTSGLAHFCEHLLFMGTRKFPAENEYSSYLARHSGHSNAYTAAEHTNYYFEVDSMHLEGALDRFAQFFISPLFSQSCKDREIKAVDSENKKNLQSDTWRLYQLDKSTSNPHHPYNGFSTGNMQTLGEAPAAEGRDVREVLMKFWQEQYSSNIMSMVVLGRESLDELCGWAETYFDQIEDKQLSWPDYDGKVIYDQHQLGKCIRAKPIMDSHKLELSFMVPDDQESHWDSKPSGYFSHLLGHEGKGSISYRLNQQLGWVNELSSGNMKVCRGSSIFVVEMDLTPEGLKHWQEIVVQVFEYLAIVKQATLEEQLQIHQEVKTMSEINFKFRQKAGASSTVSKMSNGLYKFHDGGNIPSEYVLNSSVIRKFDENKIREFASYLVPENFRVTLASQTLDGLDHKEQWYGTEYSYGELDQELMKKLTNGLDGSNEHFHLPLVNDFLPENFTVYGKKAKDKSAVLKHPYLLVDEEKLQVWYKQDDQFEVPKGTVECLLHVPPMNAGCRSAVMSGILTDLVDDELNDAAYYASIVGLSFQIHAWRDGVVVKVSGYNDKLSVLMEKVLGKLLEFKPKRDRFEAIKSKITQDYKNFGYNVPYSQIGTHFLTFINEKTYTYGERLKELETITFENMDQWVNEAVWSEGVFAEVLVQGNFRVEDAEQFSTLFKEKLAHLDISTSTRALQSYRLPAGTRTRYTLPLEDAQNINSCIEYYIQISDIGHDRKLRVLTDLLGTIIHEPCFNQLRTKEQLGYVVFSGTRTTRTAVGFRILVQSERTSDYLEYRIEEFLRQFGKFVNTSLSPQDFESFKEALKSKKLTKLKNLSEEVSRFWNNITDGFYDFESKVKEVDVLESITLDEFQTFFKNYIDVEASDSRVARAIVHLQSQCPTTPSQEKLVHSAVINYLYKQGLHLGADTVDGLVEKYSDKLQELSHELVDALAAYVPSEQEEGQHEGNKIEDKDALEQELHQVLKRGLTEPVPSAYPTGEPVTLEEFKKNSSLGGLPVPVQPLSDFYYPSDQEDEHAHL